MSITRGPHRSAPTTVAAPPTSRRRGWTPPVLAGLLLSAALLLAGGSARGEEASPPHVTFSRSSGAFSKPLPVKTQFFIDIPVDQAFDKVSVTYWNMADHDACTPPPKVGPNTKKLTVEQSIDKDKKSFFVPISPLGYDAHYCFSMTFSMVWSDAASSKVAAVLGDIAAEVVKPTSKTGVTEAFAEERLTARLGEYKDLTVSGKPLIKAVKAWVVGKWIQPRSQMSTDYTNAADAIREKCLKLGPKAKAIEKTTDKALESTIKSINDTLRVACPSLPDPAKDGEMEAPSEALLAHGKTLETTLKAINAILAEKCADPPPEKLAKTCTDLRDYSLTLDTISDSIAKLASVATQYDKLDESFRAQLGEYMKDIQTVVKPFQTVTVASSFTGRAGLYISGDVGFMIPFFPSAGSVGFSPLVGVSFYFIPVDKDTPLRDVRGIGNQIGSRLAVTGGLAFNVKDPAGTVHGVLDSTSVFFGAGVRVTDYVRLTGGAVVVLQKHRNPLLDSESVRLLPYVGASVDLDVVGTVKDLITSGKSSSSL